MQRICVERTKYNKFNKEIGFGIYYKIKDCAYDALYRSLHIRFWTWKFNIHIKRTPPYTKEQRKFKL